MSNIWKDRDVLRIFAIIETRKDGKCGVIMTSDSRHIINGALCKMTLIRKRPRTSLHIAEFRETVKP